MSNLSNPVSSSHPERNIFSIPPLFFLSLFFALGIWSASLISFSFVVIALIAFLVLCVFALANKNVFFVPLGVFMFFVLGILFGLNDRTPSSRDIALSAPAGPLTLEGKVVSVPEIDVKGRKQTVSFIVSSRNFYKKPNRHSVPATGKVQVFLHNPGHEIYFGDELRLRGILEIPPVSRNPHSFDYARYLARNGIKRTFRGIGKYSVLRRQKGNGNFLLLQLNCLRVHLKMRLEALFPAPYAELASALVLGFRKNIPREIQDAFIQTGTAHLIAISGLNISLVAGLFYVLNQIFGIRRGVNLFLSAVFVVLYTILAGASFPVLRAGIMGIMVLLGFLMGQERNLKSALFFAFFVLLIFNPAALFHASFQLSFIAMAALIFILPRLEKMILPAPVEESFPFSRIRSFLGRIQRSLIQTLFASIAATMGMFPILSFYFHLFSFVGFLANLIVVPVCTIGIALSLILLVLDFICAPLAIWFQFLPLIFLKLEIWLVQFFSHIPAGFVYIPSPPPLAFFLYYGFLAAWLFLPAKWVRAWIRSACLAGVGVTSLVFSVCWQGPSSHFTFFDFGKSSHAAYFSFSDGTNCLVNTGKHFPNDQAYWILRPFLMGSQVHRLDGILLTEVNGVYAGGFRTLENYIRFRKLWIPSEFKIERWNKFIGFERHKNQKIDPLSEGDRLQFGAHPEIHIEILAVQSGQILALKIQDRKSKILYLTSARPGIFERLENSPDIFDVIFIPHSDLDVNESEIRFLKKASPQFIVSGQRKFSPEFRAKLESLASSKVLFLEESGAASFRFFTHGFICKTAFNSLSDF